MQFTLLTHRTKRGNLANSHDRLKQVPVLSAECHALAVDCAVSRALIQIFTYGLVTSFGLVSRVIVKV